MPNYQYIEVSQQNDVTVVQVLNPTVQDRLLINELGDELIDFVEREKPQKLLIGFERVAYCSSEMIGGLIRARRRVLNGGGSLKLCSLRPTVRRIFVITHVEGTVFDIYETAEEAIAAF